MTSIGFIGVGELALYTIDGVMRGGYPDPVKLSPRNRGKALDLAARHGCEILDDNQAVVSACDCVIIATRPAQCLETLASLEFKPGQLLVSVVAGMPIAQLKSVVAPGLDIVRAMPVSSAGVSASPTLVYPCHEFVCRFFDHCGEAIATDSEAAFEQGSVLACVYSWFFQLFETLIQANQGAALSTELSARLVMGMARGAAELALADQARSPGEIAAAIATEGTFSRLGLDLLEQHNAFQPWREASELLRQKLGEND